jgi:serine/threonine protein kinase
MNLNTANALTLQQFAREKEISAQLNHPHIVTVYETSNVVIGVGEPVPFIVMELVHGTSLDELRGLTYARIVDIGQQICDALEYAHNQGLVYRDLKPGNVILEKRGFRYFVKLLDFGLARPRGEAYLPNESNLAGTTFYLAPELIAGQPADIGSDLYALGAVLYEMITGRVPFSDIDEQNILSQHSKETVSPPSHSRSDVPRALEAIVLRLLEKSPKDRFASAQEVRHALERVDFIRESTSHGNLPKANYTANENEIVQVIQLLESNQLVTLLDNDETLALAVGEQLTNEFEDGVWLVQLESIHEPGELIQTVASVLDVHEIPNRPLAVSLIEALREKNLLILLGHCDHLLSACAQLAETIIRACPEVYILATTHQPLNISTEKCYRRSLN